ncbi:MAG: AAA family ATPase [Nitrospirae bacterium]|nr:AAA family ATPase [Nitrospirota bacterium]
MITRIEVNGFKSLAEFSLDLRQGLNVLVGPNGGGKTNIVLFFEFLSTLVRTDVSEAISRLGGAGAVFRRIGDKNFQETIQATVYGCQLINKNKFCHYKYFFEILFTTELESVVFKKQSLNINIGKSFVEAEDNLNKKILWKIVIEQNFKNDMKPEVIVKAKNPKNFFLFQDDRKEKNDSNIMLQVRNLIARMSSAQVSLLQLLFRFDPIFIPVFQDMVSGEIYNIVPSKVIIPEDSSKAAGIAKDGSGLSATLYAIKMKKGITDRHIPTFYKRNLITKLSLEDLQKYINLANNSIDAIDVANDTFNNQLKVTLKIVNADYTAILPLSSMSDGTIKWIAMITAVFTTKSMFAIEEPENYLHPLMQSQILDIMRNIHTERRDYSFSLITTHSETILNSCNPEELIVVSFSEGKTYAKRCSNKNELKDEIKRTGFGLGYYYLAGAIENE